MMMMKYWGGYGSIVNDSDYDISTTTTLNRQLSSLQGYMDPKSTNLCEGKRSEDNQAKLLEEQVQVMPTQGFVVQRENFGRFSNQIIELQNLSLMARALDRIAITSIGLELLPLFDLAELNKIASGRTCTNDETNPINCCRVKGWHYDEDPAVSNLLKGLIRRYQIF